LEAILRGVSPQCQIVPVESVTQGAACTVLLAQDLIDNNAPLMIANTDQYVDLDLDAYLASADTPGRAGLIMTFEASDPKWSFVRRDFSGRVVEILEKQPVSREATVGIYNFRRGCDFVRAAQAMIAADQRVNGEFYVAPTYNPLIAEGASVETFGIAQEGVGMHGLGTPADLERFLALDLPLPARA
jgi:dTDP-glucose pyrophosphorylase